MLTTKLLSAAKGGANTVNVVGTAITTGTSMFIPQTFANQLVVMYTYATLTTATAPTASTPSGFTQLKTYNSANPGGTGKGIRLNVNTRFGAFAAGTVSGVRGTGFYTAAVALILERPSQPFTTQMVTTNTTSAWYAQSALTANTDITGLAPSTSTPYLMVQFASRAAGVNSSEFASTSGFGTSLRVAGTSGNVSVIYYASNIATSNINILAASSSPTADVVDWLY